MPNTATAAKMKNTCHPMRNGKPLKTPAGHEIAVPTEALCRAIEQEWAPIQGLPKLGQIPLTQYVNTTLDHIATARESVLSSWLSHAESDLLCYRAEAPQELVARQQKVWQPHLDWLKNETGAHLAVTCGIVPQPQPREALDALRRAAEPLDDFHLTGLSQATALLGSAVLGLAFVRKHIDATAALAAALLDELYQSDQWGEPEELTARREDLTRELNELARFLALLDS